MGRSGSRRRSARPGRRSRRRRSAGRRGRASPAGSQRGLARAAHRRRRRAPPSQRAIGAFSRPTSAGSGRPRSLREPARAALSCANVQRKMRRGTICSSASPQRSASSTARRFARVRPGRAAARDTAPRAPARSPASPRSCARRASAPGPCRGGSRAAQQQRMQARQQLDPLRLDALVARASAAPCWPGWRSRSRKGVLARGHATQACRRPRADARTVFEIDAALRQLVEAGGSDLHLKVGAPPLVRVNGDRSGRCPASRR